MKSSKTLACLIIPLLSTAAVIVLASSAYDSIECDPHSNRARTGRARLIESIPCDLSKQSYCNLPGESYPWNAVKKFVYDNQGLVRRMYGDQRHIFVMQSELENEIDFDDIKHSADKYSKTFNGVQRKQKKPHARQAKAKKSPATTKRNTERKNYRSGDATEPHFRPATNSKQRTKPPKVNVNEQVEKSSLIDNFIQSNVDALDVKVTTKLTSIMPSSSASTTTTSAATSTTEASTSASEINGDVSDRKSSVVDIAALDLFGNVSASSASSTPSSTLKTSVSPTTTKTTATLSSATEASTTTTTTSKTAALNVSSNETSESPLGSLKTTLNVLPDDAGYDADDEQDDGDDDEDTTEATASTSSKGDTKTTTKTTTTTTTTTEAQLYQDHAIVPTMNRRGVNACPVKEEVVAPFWGNNTRGEILALLNVYPFEQYINWEKCTHEHEQMYCRKGCRCEQQYRLHRLLAYNPLDACRGIFSDWFRFPSCCICKCYDIPFDYRVTSRSPRGSDRVLDVDETEAVDNEEEEEEAEFSLFDNDEDENYFDDPE